MSSTLVGSSRTWTSLNLMSMPDTPLSEASSDRTSRRLRLSTVRISGSRNVSRSPGSSRSITPSRSSLSSAAVSCVPTSDGDAAPPASSLPAIETTANAPAATSAVTPTTAPIGLATRAAALTRRLHRDHRRRGKALLGETGRAGRLSRRQVRPRWSSGRAPRARWRSGRASGRGGTGTIRGGKRFGHAVDLSPDPPLGYGGADPTIRGKGVLSWEDDGHYTCHEPCLGGHLFDAIIAHPRFDRSDLR